MTMEILTTHQAPAWTRIIESCANWDFYHSPQYHVVAESFGEGVAYLFHYHEGPYSVALPLLVRPLDDVQGLGEKAAGWQDATSVYGYAGPLASHSDMPAEVIRKFQTELEERLRDLHIVAVFSRLHPLLEQQRILEGLGECEALIKTVSIDLTLPPELQRAAYRATHRRSIKKARAHGIVFHADRSLERLDEFVDIYYETMRRVRAAPQYFFPHSYFHKMATALGKHFHLLCVLKDERIVSAGIFIEGGGVLQYHLGGTRDAALPLAPMKTLVDDVRHWAVRRGLRVFHLGGGVTPRQDDLLLHFKLGFSNRTHDFRVWRWIVFPDVYRSFCAEKSNWNHRHGAEVTTRVYFPEYRSPTRHDPTAQPQHTNSDTTHQRGASRRKLMTDGSPLTDAERQDVAPAGKPNA